MQARCRLGFERRVDAAIYQTASEAKTRTQSSEHGVVATGKHGDLLGGSFVERHVQLLRGPEAMEQDSQLTRKGNYGLALGLLAATSREMEAPLSECGVPPMRSEDVVRTLNQQTSEIGVASLGDAELWVAFAGLTASWSQTEVATHVSTSLEALLAAKSQHKR
jgi:hypothetical protein